jgi:hypothetical protein
MSRVYISLGEMARTQMKYENYTKGNNSKNKKCRVPVLVHCTSSSTKVTRICRLFKNHLLNFALSKKEKQQQNYSFLGHNVV